MTTFRRGAAMLAAGFMVVGGAGAAVAQPVDDKTNQAGYWADLLMDPEGPYAEEGFVDVECFKLDGEQFYGDYGDYFEGDWDEDGEPDAWTFSPDDPWLAVVLKSGSEGASVEEENNLFLYVEAGDWLAHESGKEISHIILCDGDVMDDEEPTEEPEQPTEEPEQPTEEPEQPGTPGGGGDDAGTPIGPVVQTDVPVQGVNPALPLAALAAGVGLAAFGLRRRGQES
jgi:hypothetical protein